MAPTELSHRKSLSLNFRGSTITCVAGGRAGPPAALLVALSMAVAALSIFCRFPRWLLRSSASDADSFAVAAGNCSTIVCS